jgi:hypothetical protein
MRSARTGTIVLAAAIGISAGITAQTPTAAAFDEELLHAFTFRNVGPFRMGARTSAIAVPASPAKAHLYTFYVSFWSGGVWKTTNNGTTFEPVFDAQDNLNVGAVAVAPSREMRSRREARTRATASTNPRTAGRPGRTWAFTIPSTSRGLPSILGIPTSCTSRQWDTSIRRTKSAACSRRSTAAGRGRRFSTSIRMSGSSIS